MTYQLTENQNDTLSRIANSGSVTFTVFGADKELDELIELGLLTDVSLAFMGQLRQYRTTASDTGRVLCLTETALSMFFDREQGHIN
jgi:hypothetical protein